MPVSYFHKWKQCDIYSIHGRRYFWRSWSKAIRRCATRTHMGSGNQRKKNGWHPRDIRMPAAGFICRCIGALLIAPLMSLYHYCTNLAWTPMQLHGDTYTLKIEKSADYRPLWSFADIHKVTESRYRLSIPNFIYPHNSFIFNGFRAFSMPFYSIFTPFCHWVLAYDDSNCRTADRSESLVTWT